MEALEAILTRRSVREFTGDPVSKTDLNDLLKAGMQAPSARNGQPWHFVVIDDPEVLHTIPDLHPFSRILLQAPLAILVCSEHNLESEHTNWMLDCSAATQNILLAAHAKGLGAVWLGIYQNPERSSGIRKLLKLPEAVETVSLVAVGHPAFRPEPENRFNETRIHTNQW